MSMPMVSVVWARVKFRISIIVEKKELEEALKHIVTEFRIKSFWENSYRVKTAIIELPKEDAHNIVNAGKIKKLTEWQVLDEDSLSGHKYIKFHILQEGCKVQKQPQLGWKLDKMNQDIFLQVLKENEAKTPKDLVALTTKACQKAMPKKGHCQKTPVFWWNKLIGEKRKQCTSCRRKYTRARRKKGMGNLKVDIVRENELFNLKEKYRVAKMDLQLEITKAKAQNWKNLCDEIDKDTWGLGYRIVTKKLHQRPPSLDMGLINSVVEILFPQHKSFGRIVAEETHFAEVTEEEIEKAAEGLKFKKAPGHDLRNPEIVKLAAKMIPDKIKNIINVAMKTGNFPTIWKKGRLVLLRKDAVLVIAGLVPIAKLVKERAMLFESKDLTSAETRELILQEWDRDWRGQGKGTWTRELIPDLIKWHKREHGEVDRWLTQALCGHGVFKTYLFAIGKAQDESCYFCDEEDTPRHALFECPGTTDVRAAAEGTNEGVNASNLISRMLSSEEQWQKYAHMLRTTMKRREEKETEQKRESERKQQEGQHEEMHSGSVLTMESREDYF
ncbi:uncharacterized protein LOC128199854 [Bicyclus anynana]|uniref:Uncharacterized protein LOC128199854 n=1 Tax=Bicyclus anynana TaxID=110368 RepID=A0ABM3M680_BICAN|nr:uncharacterized protein LOC128199854 [Bicyclus anynana]